MSDFDPPEPPEQRERLNAKNLKGAYLVLLPGELGYWPAKPEERDDQGNVTKRAQKEQPFIACDVWVFDRAGILNSDTGIRFTWWRAVEQLKDRIGVYTMCRPVEQEDRSVILNALTGQARETGLKIIAEIEAGDHPQAAAPESGFPKCEAHGIESCLDCPESTEEII